jgi:GMP synthase-like glutamine amidotransferase
LPKNATLLASSKVCVNQAFQMGKNVIGLQFHLETTPESLEDISIHCGNEIVEAEFVQSANKMASVSKENFVVINQLMNDILSFITRK